MNFQISNDECQSTTSEKCIPYTFSLYVNNLEEFLDDKKVDELKTRLDELKTELNNYLKLFVIVYADGIFISRVANRLA